MDSLLRVAQTTSSWRMVRRTPVFIRGPGKGALHGQFIKFAQLEVVQEDHHC